MDKRDNSNVWRYRQGGDNPLPMYNSSHSKIKMSNPYHPSGEVGPNPARYKSSANSGSPNNSVRPSYYNHYSSKNQQYNLDNNAYPSNPSTGYSSTANWNSMNPRSYSRNNYPYTATTSNENYGDPSMTDSWNRHRNSGMDDSYSQRDWIDPSTPYGYSTDVSYYNQPSYTPQPSAEPPSSTFATTNYYHDYSHYPISNRSSSSHSPIVNDYPSLSLYDFNDLSHSYYGIDDITGDDGSYEDNFWVNVPSHDPYTPSFAPTTTAPSSHSLFGFSDSVYLDPLDCEGISEFNKSTGIHAPRLTSSFTPRFPPESITTSSTSSVSPIPLPSKKESYSPPPINPPIHLACLWNEPVYRRIWDAFDYAKKQRLQGISLVENKGDEEIISRQIELGIQEKKHCRIRNARSIFVELAIEFSSNVQVWLEFTRLEMECGEYRNARIVLETASSQHPHNELLLQKRLRVEERLRSVSNVIAIINELRCMDTQKSMKILIEGISILGKLGYEKMAVEYGKSISMDSKYFSGNLYLELMLCQQRCGSLKILLQMADQALILFPKYGPLWFFCFNLIEHVRVLNWDKKNMRDLINADDLERSAEMARGNLTADILWKVFLYRAEFWYRCCMYLRMTTFDDPLRINELLLTEFQISKYVNGNMARCIEVCPANLLWKMYIVIARYSAFVGYRQLGRKLLQRSYRLAPVKSRHAVLLEYSKLECIARHMRCSLGLLNYGILQFPTEWKLLLERIQQLVLTEQYTDALRLNIHALKTHVGAGRLWSSYIHIIHQVFGPDAAMQSFREALKHVAKSGEVWCEGARIYLNPVSKHFHLLNASKCLNYAVFFTPQYGDSFIEAIRLAVLSSNVFLECSRISSPFYMSTILRAIPVIPFMMKRCSFFEPNYGPLWFRCQEYLLSSPKEVLYRSYYLTVLEIAQNKDLYYEAMMRRSIAHFKKMKMKSKYSTATIRKYEEMYGKDPISPIRKEYTYSFKPEYMLTTLNEPQQLVRQMKCLYGASQLDS